MRLPRPFSISASAGLVAALVFWLACGPRFEYMVVAGGQGWHAEKFTPFGTMLLAAMLGAAVALCTAAALWIVRQRTR